MNHSKQPLLIMGTGGLVAEATDMAEETGRWRVEGYVSERKIDLKEIGGIPVHPLSEYASMADTHAILCAQVATNRNHFIEQAIGAGFQFCSLIHPTAHVSTRARLGSGVIIGANAAVLSHVQIGDYAIVLANATVSHHARVGACSTVAGGTTLAGLSSIGKNTFVGINASILPERRIGDHCMIGAGSVVTRDVPDHATVFGNPARIRP